MTEPLIRPAVEADIAALHRLIESGYRGDSARRGWTSEADLLGGQRTDPEALAELFVDPGQAMLAAEIRGDLVGCVQIAVEDDLGYFGMLTVDPSRQSGGLGRRLVRAAEAALAGRWGVKRVEITVFWQREELIAWYERLGYARTGRTQAFDVDNPRLGLPLRADLHFLVLGRDLD